MFLRTSNLTSSPYNFVLRAPDDGGAGTEGTTDPTGTEGAKDPDTGADEIKKLIEKAVEDAVAGLKRKNSELIGKEKDLRAKLAAAEGKPTLSEDEYTQFKTLKEKIERDELLRLFTEGKSEEVVDRVTRKTRLDYEAKVAAEAEARTKASQEAETWKTRYETSLVSAEISKAAAAGMVKPNYQDLVVKLVNEHVRVIDGVPRVVNSEGAIEMTAKGDKPMSVGDYVESLRTSYPDIFIPSSGGGAGGSPKRQPAGNSTKLAMEVAANLSMDEYARLRAEGKI